MKQCYKSLLVCSQDSKFMAHSKPLPIAIRVQLKDLGSNPDEIMYGLSGLSREEQMQLFDLITKTKDFAKSGQQVEVVVSDKKKPNRRVSAAVGLIREIRDSLHQYEASNDHSLDLEIDVKSIIESIDKDYTKQEDKEFVTVLKSYEDQSKKCNFLSLLICFAKGKVFDEFKQKHRGTFKDSVRQKLGYSYESVRRYIEFARVVAKYNRLLACNQSYTTISVYLTDIETHADENADFGALMKAGLRDIKVGNESIPIDKLTNAMKRLAIVVVNQEQPQQQQQNQEQQQQQYQDSQQPEGGSPTGNDTDMTQQD
jgi:hypothetical protein